MITKCYLIKYTSNFVSNAVELLYVSLPRDLAGKNISLTTKDFKPIAYMLTDGIVYFMSECKPGVNYWLLFEDLLGLFTEHRHKIPYWENVLEPRLIYTLWETNLSTEGWRIEQDGSFYFWVYQQGGGWAWLTTRYKLKVPQTIHYTVQMIGDWGWYGTKYDGITEVYQPTYIDFGRYPYRFSEPLHQGAFALFGCNDDWYEYFATHTLQDPPCWRLYGTRPDQGSGWLEYVTITIEKDLVYVKRTKSTGGEYTKTVNISFTEPKLSFGVWSDFGTQPGRSNYIRSMKIFPFYVECEDFTLKKQAEIVCSYNCDIPVKFDESLLLRLYQKRSCSVLAPKERAVITVFCNNISQRATCSYVAISQSNSKKISITVGSGRSVTKGNAIGTFNAYDIYFDPLYYPEVCKWYPPPGYRDQYIYKRILIRRMPYMGIYTVRGNAMLYRESDNKFIKALDMQINCSIDNYCWDFSATLADEESFNLVKPTDGNPICVVADVNGHVWKFYVTSWGKRQTFGQTRYTIAGASRSIELNQEKVTFAFENDVLAKQVVETVLANTGWAYLWGVKQTDGNDADWLIKKTAAVWGNKTIIEIIGEIATCAGAFVYSHQQDKTIIIKPVLKHPIWRWRDYQPSYEINNNIYFDISEQIAQNTAEYNGVWLVGETADCVLIKCRISGTPGDPTPGQMVTNRLLTDGAIAPFLAQKELSLLRPHLTASISMPLFSLDSPVNLCLPGDFVRIDGRYGSVTATRISVSWQKESGLKVRQDVNLILEVA